MKKYVLIFLSFSIFFSCDRYDEDVLPVTGVYDGNIQGYAGYFSISVSIDRGDDILIDAPWDGVYWMVAQGEVCDEENYEKGIHIPWQELEPGIWMEGDGVYFEGTLQIDYELEIEGWGEYFTMIGSK